MKTIEEVLLAYNLGYPFQSQEKAQEMAELFGKVSSSARKYGDIFYPIEVEGGWGVCQDLKH